MGFIVFEEEAFNYLDEVLRTLIHGSGLTLAIRKI